jgi:hypothetical protein
MGARRGVCRVSVGKPEEKSPLGRPKCRWEDNNRIDLQVVGCGDMNWIGLAQDKHTWLVLVNAVINFRVS